MFQISIQRQRSRGRSWLIMITRRFESFCDEGEKEAEAGRPPTRHKDQRLCICLVDETQNKEHRSQKQVARAAPSHPIPSGIAQFPI